MHLIIDIRSASPVDPIMTRYAGSWVDLWLARHPTDRISYIHYVTQECPENGRSIVVTPSSWWSGNKALSIEGVNEIFRCVNFSSYPPYDSRINTISHVWDHASILYPREEHSLIERFFGMGIKNRNKKGNLIIVPSLSVGQEAVEISHTSEEDIQIIPYITLTPGKGDRHTLTQLSISGPYWIYDGSYGSESNIHGLLKGYYDYRSLGGSHTLLLIGKQSANELRDISLQVQQLDITGSVRIIGTLESDSIESLYMHASGWIYIGAYYASGPRIELARSHHIPLLISDISSLSDYHATALCIHPNHLNTLGESLQYLEQGDKKIIRKISNDDIMKGYEKIISEKR